MATSKDRLLDLFADNNTQEIEAKDLREFVNAIYDESVIKGENVIDNLNSAVIELPLSANQGRMLNNTKEPLLPNINNDGMILKGDSTGIKYWAKERSTLGMLDDVFVDGADNWDTLTYNNGVWKPSSLSVAIGNISERGGVSFNDTKRYYKGDVISYNDVLYTALVDMLPNRPPDTYPGGWKVTKSINVLNDLDDVNTSGLLDNNYLKSNNGTFSPSNFNRDVKDIVNTSIVEGVGIDVTYDGITDKTKVSLNANIGNLNDVHSSMAVIGDILLYDGNKWIADNILDTLDKGGSSWTNDTLYPIGIIVTHNNEIYKSVRPNLGQEPGLTNDWKILSLKNLPDTNLETPEDKDLIIYNQITQMWEQVNTTLIGDAGNEFKIPMLDSRGKLDPSMLEVTLFHRIDSWDPTIEEYPDTTGHILGAFWDIYFFDGVTTEYTYTTGDLVGRTVKQGDFIIWGIGGWTIMPAIMNPLHYYKRDGSQPLTANLAGGGFKISDISEGTSLNDGVTLSQLNTKENHLGYPSQNDLMLTSDVQGNRNWVQVPESGVKDHNLLNNRDLSNQHPISSITDLTDELNNRFIKTEFIEVSLGGQDQGKPIVLNSQGKVDPSMLDVSSFYYVGPWTPTQSDEYPDTTGETYGAFWVIENLPLPYTFIGGDLVGQTVTNGDYMVWTINGWSVISNDMNPSLYYKLDGSQAITGNFAGGGQQIKNIANGTDNSDAINLYQHTLHTNNTNNPHLVTKSQVGLSDVENLTPQDLPISDDTQTALDGKENWLGNPLADGMVLISDTTGNRSWTDYSNKTEWGNITGTLSNQTDLYNELDNRVMVTGDIISGDLIVQEQFECRTLTLGMDNDGLFKSKIIFNNISGGEATIFWDNNERDFFVTTTSTNSWTLWHRGNLNPNDFIHESGDTMTGPLSLFIDPVNDLDATNKKYVDEQVASIVIPPDLMTKGIYDTNDNGIVDDSEKFGGQEPSYYATQTDLDTKVSKSGDTITGDLSIQGEFDTELVTVGLNVYLNNDSRIRFTDQNYPNHPPSIFWNGNSKNFMIDTHNGAGYTIYHSGNLNPDFLHPIIRRSYIGDGSTTTFDVPEKYTPHNIDVYYNGVKINEDDVDVSNGTNIIFNIAPDTDDRIDIVAYKNRLLGDIVENPLI